MEFTQSLKAKAQQIFELSSQLGERAHTWNQEASAPDNGYTDRAGFIIYDDIELFADIYASEDGVKSLLRARLAWTPKSENDQYLFTIITLDFNADEEKVKAIIADHNNLTQQNLVSLLKDPNTKPNFIHVSLGAGTNSAGQKGGKRYEYNESELLNISTDDQSEFITTLNEAYSQITSKI